MSEIVKTSTQTVETSKEQTEQAQPRTTAKKDQHAHHHHHHRHTYISPVASGSSHLNPGSITIGRR